MEGLAEHGVFVIDAPRSLQHRVEETVTSRTVPEGIETTIQSSSQLQRPVDDGRLLLEFCTKGEEKRGVQNLSPLH